MTYEVTVEPKQTNDSQLKTSALCLISSYTTYNLSTLPPISMNPPYNADVLTLSEKWARASAILKARALVLGAATRSCAAPCSGSRSWDSTCSIAAARSLVARVEPRAMGLGVVCGGIT